MSGPGRPGRTSSLVRLAVKAYAAAVRVLPSDFREEYGAELVACFRRIVRESHTHGAWAVVSVTVRAIVDLARRAPVEHLAAARAGTRSRGPGLQGTWQDMRHAARRLRRNPSFTVASVGALALGIAAAASVFSLVHGVVLSPLPYPQSHRIVQVDHSAPGLGIDRMLGVTYGFYRFYAERVDTAESMAMYSSASRTLTGEGDPVKLSGILTTPSLGAVLGVVPAVGRWLTEGDGEPDAPLVVVLSHGLWLERFGADPSVVGDIVDLDGVPTEVVGVADPEFAFPDSEAAFWVPRSVPSVGVGGWNAMAVARLSPGSDPGDLEQELSSLLPLLRESTDDPARIAEYLDDARVTPRIVTLKESVVGDVRATLWILMGTVGFVLLIALANVANLFLVRGESGQRETAVRAALGAGRARIARTWLMETLLVAGMAGVIGVVLAHRAVAVLKNWAPVNVPRLQEVGLDPTVLAVSGGTVLLSALLLGLIPAFRGGRDVSAALKEGGRRTTTGRRGLRGRNLLVTGQVALTMVLLVGSGLLFRTFQELRHVELGFGARQALTFQIGLAGDTYETRAEMIRFHDELLNRLLSVPGVEAAGAVGACLPLTPNMCWGETLEAEGLPTPVGTVPPVTGARVVTEGYFEAMDIAVRGRMPGSGDGRDGPPAAVISESTARAYFGDTNPLGQRIRQSGEGEWHEIVGIAADVRARIESEDFLRVLYIPMRPQAEGIGPPPSPMSYVLRTSVPPATLAGEVRRAVAALDPTVPLAAVETLDERIARATGPAAFALTLVGLAAVIALVLGGVGVYAVVAYTVSRRTAEIGIRMALGATAAQVRGLVFRQGGVVVAAGIALGLAAALLLSRMLEGMLYGVSPTDPASYALLTGLMAAVATLALYLPARRASRVDPREAIGDE